MPLTLEDAERIMGSPPRTRGAASPDLDTLIDELSAEHGVDPTLVRAIMQTESAGNPRSVSPKGAQGLMQLMPATAKQYGVTDPFDPLQNLTGGVKHLKRLGSLYPDNPALVAAAYNAGEGAVAQHGGIPPYPETQAYVTKVTGRLNGNGKATPGLLTLEDAERIMAAPLPQPETVARVDRDLPPSLEMRADEEMAARLSQRLPVQAPVVSPTPILPPTPVMEAPRPPINLPEPATGWMGLDQPAGLRSAEEAQQDPNLLTRLGAGAVVGAAAPIRQVMASPAEGGTKDVAARLGEIFALPFSVPFSALTNSLIQSGAISPQTAEELGKLSIALTPTLLGPEAHGLRYARRLRMATEKAAPQPTVPEAWTTPEGQQFLGLIDALQARILRGSTAEERAAAAAGLNRTLAAYGVTLEDLPPGTVRVNPQLLTPQPLAIPAQTGMEPPRTGRGRQPEPPPTAPTAPPAATEQPTATQVAPPVETPPVAPPAPSTAQPSTVPERPATVVAQTQAVAEGRKPAVLVPPTMQTVETAEGTVVYDPQQVTQTPEEIQQAVESGKGGEILGYGVAEKPQPGEPAALVETRGPQGEEIQTVVSPVPVPPAVTDAAERVKPEGGTVAVTPPEETEARAQEVVEARQAEAPPLTIADADRIMGAEAEEKPYRHSPETIKEVLDGMAPMLTSKGLSVPKLENVVRNWDYVEEHRDEKNFEAVGLSDLIWDMSENRGPFRVQPEAPPATPQPPTVPEPPPAPVRQLRGRKWKAKPQPATPETPSPVGFDSALQGKSFHPGTQDAIVLDAMKERAEGTADVKTGAVKVDALRREDELWREGKTAKPEWMKIDGTSKDYYEYDEVLKVIEALQQGTWPAEDTHGRPTPRRERIAEQLAWALKHDAENEKARAGAIVQNVEASQRTAEEQASRDKAIEDRLFGEIDRLAAEEEQPPAPTRPTPQPGALSTGPQAEIFTGRETIGSAIQPGKKRTEVPQAATGDELLAGFKRPEAERQTELPPAPPAVTVKAERPAPPPQFSEGTESKATEAPKPRSVRERPKAAARQPMTIADAQAEGERIADFGETIGEARKHLAEKTGPRDRIEEQDERPAWQRKYHVGQIEKSRRPEETGKWQIVYKPSGQPIRKVFNTEAEATAAIPLLEVSRNHRVYSAKGEGGAEEWQIVRIMGEGRKRPVVKGGFPSQVAATEYMATHPAEIIEHKFPFPERPWLDRIERIGKERRTGDVTPAMFQETFGFRGGQFGNWNMGGEGQAALNFAYDALLDLSDTLGVPPSALSLNGDLAIAFGARGHGGKEAARAHYEPDWAVINLTKIKGAGALAHEWFHALDHYIARQEGKAGTEKDAEGRFTGKGSTGTHVTEGFSYKSKAKPDIVKAFKAVVDAMTATTSEEAIPSDMAAKNHELATSGLKDNLRDLRNQFTYDRSRYKARWKAPTEAQLKAWDALADRILANDVGEKKTILNPKSKFGVRDSYEAIEQLNELYKSVVGHSFATMDENSQGRYLMNAIRHMQMAKARVEKAEAGGTETRKRQTDYYKEAREIDSYRASDYWSTAPEMGARAFESYIYDKMTAAGSRSDYLVYGVENKHYALLGLKPYPEGVERTRINEAFDNLLKNIETREEGGRARFTITADNLNAIVDRGIRTSAEADAAADTVAASRQQFESATGAERASLAKALTNLDRAIRTFDDTQVSDVAPYRSTESVSAPETPLEKPGPGADIIDELQQEAVRHVTRDTATDTDRALARAVVADLAASGDAESVKPPRRLRGRGGAGAPAAGDPRPADRRTGPPAILGLGISHEIANLGRIDLRGRSVASIRDVAHLAQVYRDPRVETFRIVYTKGDEIVAVEGVSSRLPGESKSFTEKTTPQATVAMRDRMKRLGADGYYLLHNHPSGHSQPSDKDIRLSRIYSSASGDSPQTPRGVPGFRGHVIINSGEYSVIAPETYAVTTVPIQTEGPDALHVPSTPHPVVGMAANDAQRVAEAGKLIQQRDGWVTVLYISGGKGVVRAIEEIPESWIANEKHMRQYLTGRTRAYGAVDVVAFSPRPGNALYAGLHDLVRRAILTDAVVMSQNTGIGMPNAGAPRALVHPRIARVESPRAYQGEEWFKKVKEEAEEPQGAPPESIGPGAQAPGESQPAEPFVTSTKHAVKDAEREARGLERIAKPETFTNQTAWDEAKRQLNDDPDIQDRLVNELVLQPRALTPVENALLLHQSVGLINERNDLAQQLENAVKNGFEERADQVKIQVERVEAEIAELEKVIHAVGTESGRSLQARRMMANQDYSLVSMEARKRIAKGGEPLTAAERDEIQRLHDEIAKLQAALTTLATTAQTAAAERQATQAVQDIKERVAKAKAKTPAEKPRDLEAERKVILSGLNKVADDTAVEDLRPWIQKLAESFVAEGITERDPLIDAVHNVLIANGIDLTRRQTMDAISGFGDFKPLNPDPIKTKLRDLKGQMQQVAKLENIASKQPIPKTGVERRVPSDEERRLIQAVEEAKRRFGVVVTDPESQLKSALDALKTRLTHEIADLEWQIANKTKITKTKSPTPTDPAVEALRAQREALKTRFDELFGVQDMTPEQRTQLAIKAAERSIADLEARIKAGDIAPRRLLSRTPVTPELVALRARQEALREQLQELRDIDVRYQEQRALRTLEKSIAEYERRITEGDLAPKPTAAGPDTPAVKEALARRDMARAALEAVREATGYYDAARIQQALKSLEEANAELLRKIRAHDLAPAAKGAQTPDTAEIRRARVEHDFLAGVLREMRAAEKPKKTPEQIALQTLKTRMAHKLADLERRLDAQDFTTPPHREVRLDAEGQRLRIELDRLTHQFKEGLVKDRLARRTRAQKVLAVIGEAFNIPRLLMTSFDLSAVLRQGGFIAFGHPLVAAEAAPSMFRALRSAANQRAVMDEILTRTNAPLYHRAKLYFSDQDTSLSRMEEAYMSRWAEKIPGIGASQRAYTTFLNRLRADTFDLLARTLRRGGELSFDEAKAIANYINVATGRGKVGAHEAGAVGLNTVFFSPRYLASRFQLLAGQPLYHGSARTRKKVAGEYGKFLLGLAAVYALAMAADADIETDPRSSDFGKIRFGKTRLDPLGGILQVTTLLTRIVTGQTKTLKGNVRSIRGRGVKFGQDDTADVVARFLRTKLSPNVGAAIDVLTGRNVVGEPVTPLSAAGRAATPLAMQDIYEALREQGATKGTALGILSIFGMGMQTYEARKKGASRSRGVIPTLDEAKFTLRRMLRGRQPEARP